VSRLFTAAALSLLTIAVSPGAFAEAESPEALVTALTRGSEGTRTRAATRLYHLGQGTLGVTPLLSRLRDEDPAERCVASRLLGVLRSEEAAAGLARALGDEDWAVRRDAAVALGQIGARGSVGPLTLALGDDHPRVRIAAARALREAAGASGDGPLSRALPREEDTEVRQALVAALAESPASRATRALRGALEDPSEPVRLAAATSLVERGDRAAAELMAERLASAPGRTSRSEAAETLGRATGAAEPIATAALSRALADPETSVQIAAAESLARLGDARGRAHLEEIAGSTEPPTTRARALELLDRLQR